VGTRWVRLVGCTAGAVVFGTTLLGCSGDTSPATIAAYDAQTGRHEWTSHLDALNVVTVRRVGPKLVAAVSVGPRCALMQGRITFDASTGTARGPVVAHRHPIPINLFPRAFDLVPRSDLPLGAHPAAQDAVGSGVVAVFENDTWPDVLDYRPYTDVTIGVLDLDSGRHLWGTHLTVRQLPMTPVQRTAIVAADDTSIYIVDGSRLVARAARSGVVRWARGAPGASSVATAGGRILLLSGHRMTAFLPSGASTWSAGDLPDNSRLVGVGDTVYVLTGGRGKDDCGD
jgi:hypothetical protein